MRYLGGKARIGKQIVAAMVADGGPLGVWWEPFCGGLNVTPHLVAHGPGIVSDAHPALIALYQAVRDGWDPPATVSRAEYQAARSLPDSNPLKAFAGFGCSFGGKWFGGYAADDSERPPELRRGRWFASAARNALIRDRFLLALVGCFSFLGITPTPGLDTIYCDPPYEGTTGYSQGAFDHPAFWIRCRSWASLGTRVYVSEYGCPVPHSVVWETAHRANIQNPGGQLTSTERLFRILP